MSRCHVGGLHRHEARSTTGIDSHSAQRWTNLLEERQRQPIAAQSSCESEFIAACKGANEVSYLHQLLGEMGYQQAEPTRVYGDNKAAKDLAHNPGMPKDRSKHFQLPAPVEEAPGVRTRPHYNYGQDTRGLPSRRHTHEGPRSGALHPHRAWRVDLTGRAASDHPRYCPATGQTTTTTKDDASGWSLPVYCVYKHRCAAKCHPRALPGRVVPLRPPCPGGAGQTPLPVGSGRKRPTDSSTSAVRGREGGVIRRVPGFMDICVFPRPFPRTGRYDEFSLVFPRFQTKIGEHLG
jgi:hypothetical protein